MKEEGEVLGAGKAEDLGKLVGGQHGRDRGMENESHFGVSANKRFTL